MVASFNTCVFSYKFYCFAIFMSFSLLIIVMIIYIYITFHVFPIYLILQFFYKIQMKCYENISTLKHNMILGREQKHEYTQNTMWFLLRKTLVDKLEQSRHQTFQPRFDDPATQKWSTSTRLQPQDKRFNNFLTNTHYYRTLKKWQQH